MNKNCKTVEEMIADVGAAIQEADRLSDERPRSRAMSGRYWRIRARAENEAYFAGVAIQCRDPLGPHKEYLARDLAKLAKIRTALEADTHVVKDRARMAYEAKLRAYEAVERRCVGQKS